MYITVFLLLNISGMLRKGIGTGVFQYEYPALLQQPARDSRRPENPVRNSIQTLEGIWRIRKDDVEVYLAYVDKVKHIVPYNMHAAYLELRYAFSDKGDMQGIHLH